MSIQGLFALIFIYIYIYVFSRENYIKKVNGEEIGDNISHKCPLCCSISKPLTESFSVLCLSKLMFKCKNKGCPKWLAYAELIEHIGSCGYELVLCKYCKCEHRKCDMESSQGVCTYVGLKRDRMDQLYLINPTGEHYINVKPYDCMAWLEEQVVISSSKLRNIDVVQGEMMEEVNNLELEMETSNRCLGKILESNTEELMNNYKNSTEDIMMKLDRVNRKLGRTQLALEEKISELIVLIMKCGNCASCGHKLVLQESGKCNRCLYELCSNCLPNLNLICPFCNTNFCISCINNYFTHFCAVCKRPVCNSCCPSHLPYSICNLCQQFCCPECLKMKCSVCQKHSCSTCVEDKFKICGICKKNTGCKCHGICKECEEVGCLRCSRMCKVCQELKCKECLLYHDCKYCEGSICKSCDKSEYLNCIYCAAPLECTICSICPCPLGDIMKTHSKYKFLPESLSVYNTSKFRASELLSYPVKGILNLEFNECRYGWITFDTGIEEGVEMEGLRLKSTSYPLGMQFIVLASSSSQDGWVNIHKFTCGDQEWEQAFWGKGVIYRYWRLKVYLHNHKNPWFRTIHWFYRTHTQPY